jgi:hypothetical protein
MAKRKRYKLPEKIETLEKYNQLRKGGTTIARACEMIGISYQTILRWEKQIKTDPEEAPSLTPKPERRKQTGITLTIENISMDKLFRVVKALEGE